MSNKIDAAKAVAVTKEVIELCDEHPEAMTAARALTKEVAEKMSHPEAVFSSVSKGAKIAAIYSGVFSAVSAFASLATGGMASVVTKMF